MRRYSHIARARAADASHGTGRQRHVYLSSQRHRAQGIGRRRAARSGQTLILFALSLTVLLGMAGLAIDLGQIFDLYGRMERAAEAGALAGVLYMPSYYNTVRPGDTNSAISRASQEIVKDGFGSVLAPTASVCPNSPTSIEISICVSPSGVAAALQVTITETYNVVLLSGLGVSPVTLSTTAQANYLTPVELGSASSFMGDQMDCSPGNALNSNSSACALNDSSHSHLQNFVMTMAGPAELKESGDAYVYCAEGPGEPDSTVSNTPFNNGVDPGAQNNLHPLATYNGLPTDHPQWSGISGSTTSLSSITDHCGPPTAGGDSDDTGNPDQQPDGYSGQATTGTAHPGAYNYELVVYPNVAAASLWIYNPAYIPQDTATSPAPLDYFLDGGICGPPGNQSPCAPNYYQGPNGEGIANRFDGIHRDAPLFYFTTTFSLYTISSIFDRTGDTLVNGFPLQYQPYDATSVDLSYHGCQPGQIYDPQWSGGNTPNVYHKPGNVTAGSGCITPGTTASSQCWLAWCEISPAAGLAPGIYRLAVEVTGLASSAFDVNGHQDYISGTTDGWGSHGYAVKMCDSITATAPHGTAGCRDGTGLGAGQYKHPDVSVAAWNNADLTFQGALSTHTPNRNYPQAACVTSNSTPYACLDIACIPSEFAGRKVGLSVFGLGQNTAFSSKRGTGGLFVGIEPPVGGGSVTYPAAVQASLQTIDGIQAVQVANGSFAPYNGLWFDVTLTIPPTYQGDCPLSPSNTGLSGVWQLMYASNDPYQVNDKITYRLTLVGSPVHLAVPV